MNKNNVEHLEDIEISITEEELKKIFDIYFEIKEKTKDENTELEIIVYLFNIVFQKKYMTIEQLDRVPIDDLIYYLNQENSEELEYYFDNVKEIITPLNEIEDGESYTIARVMDNGYCIELHYCSDIGATIEYGTKIDRDSWEATVDKVFWFNRKLSEDYILLRLNCIYERHFSDKLLSGYKSNELEIVRNVLAKHNVHDIHLHITDDDILVAYDEKNCWKGKEFYDYLFDELILENSNGEVELLNEFDLNELKKYRESYEEKNIESEKELELEYEK